MILWKKGIVVGSQVDSCPKCKSSWLKPIPPEYRDEYTGTHWNSSIGIDGGYIGVYDGIVAIKCPDCGEEFPRNNGAWALDLFKRYKEVVNE